MVERGERAVSSELASRAVDVFEVPATALPLTEYQTRARDAGFFQSMLGSLGYPGFAYLRGPVRLNPVEVLMEALDSDDLDSRVTEALAWLPLAYPHLNWGLADRECEVAGSTEPARVCSRIGASGRRERRKLPSGRGVGYQSRQAGTLAPGERRYSVQRIDDTRRAGLAARASAKIGRNTGIC